MAGLRGIRAWGVLLTLAVASVGCIRAEQELTLNADGSFDLKMNCSYDEKAWATHMASITAGLGVPAEEPEAMIKEPELRAKLEVAKAAGVEIKEFKVERVKGWLGYSLDARCVNLAAVNMTLRALDTEDEFSLVHNADDTWTLASAETPPSFLTEEKKGTDEEQQKALEKFKDFRAVFTMNVPGEIAETDAHSREGRRAQWVLDISDKNVLDKAAAMGAKGTHVTFKAPGLKVAPGELHRYILTEATLTLNADGSADAVVRRSMHDVFYKETEVRQRIGRGSSEDLANLFDETAIRKAFKEAQSKGGRQGIDLKAVKCATADGWHRATAVMHCRDLAAAREATERRDLTLTKRADGNYHVTIESPEPAEPRDMGIAALKVGLDKMERRMWEYCRERMTVKVPGDVIESNAHESKASEAQWSFDITDPKFEEKLATKKQKGSFVVFKGQGLDLKEVQPAPQPGLTPAYGYRDGGGHKKSAEQKSAETPQDGAPSPAKPAPKP